MLHPGLCPVPVAPAPAQASFTGDRPRPVAAAGLQQHPHHTSMLFLFHTNMQWLGTKWQAMLERDTTGDIKIMSCVSDCFATPPKARNTATGCAAQHRTTQQQQQHKHQIRWQGLQQPLESGFAMSSTKISSVGFVCLHVHCAWLLASMRDNPLIIAWAWQCCVAGSLQGIHSNTILIVCFYVNTPSSS